MSEYKFDTPKEVYAEAEREIEEARRKGSTVLDLSGFGLTQLPESIGQLSQLREFDVTGNQLTQLPESIGQLSQLRELSVTNNQLTHLPGSIGQLTELKVFIVLSNQLTQLPEAMAVLSQRLTQLYLHGNDKLEIPPEILGPTFLDVASGKAEPARPADIWSYYSRNRAEARRALREAKILVVGQGTVGKTCLIERLINDKYCPQNKTEGIDIKRWPLPASRGEGDLRVNVWDFGGQEVMHATHKFFLTERSLYLLVIDARKGEEESRLNYWLKIIASFGTDSPILVIINKMDEHPLQLNEPRLRKEHPNIHGFFPISCKTGDGVPALREAITKEINELPHVFDTLPESFFVIKEKLETMAQERDFLDEREYRNLCDTHKVTLPSDQNLLLRFLHDLGNVLNFADADSPHNVRDTNILNPEWVTRGVYKIINDAPLTREQGILTKERLKRILGEHDGYPGERRSFIVGMMQKFELCFRFGEDGQSRWLVLDLLSPKEIEFGWEHRDTLNFEYHYEVLPPGLISRFLVKSHSNLNLKKQSYWRTGAMLTLDDHHAIVRADPDKNRVFIAIDGPTARRRDALAVIRARFAEIHATIPGLKFEERIPLPDNRDVTVGYNYLIELEDEEEEFVRPEGASRKYRVPDLLLGVVTQDTLMKDKQRQKKGERPELNREPQAPLPLEPHQKIGKTLWAILPAAMVILAIPVLIAIFAPAYSILWIGGFGLLLLIFVVIAALLVGGFIPASTFERITQSIIRKKVEPLVAPKTLTKKPVRKQSATDDVFSDK